MINIDRKKPLHKKLNYKHSLLASACLVSVALPQTAFSGGIILYEVATPDVELASADPASVR